MASIQKCIRLPEATVREIEAAASEAGRDFSSVARDLLVEAVKELKAEKDDEIARLREQVSDLTARVERMRPMTSQTYNGSSEGARR